MAQAALMHLFVRLISVVSLIANLGLIVATLQVRSRLVAASLIAEGATVAPLTGVTMEGRHIDDRDAVRARCHLIRFSSTVCVPSNSDREVWHGMAAAANRLGCEVTLMAPSPDRMPVMDAIKVTRLAYPVMAFVEQTRFNGTPTTLLFDAHWRLVWRREGPLQPDDKKALSRLVF